VRVKYRVSEKSVHTRLKWDRGWSGSHTVNVCTVFAMGISIESDPDERETKVTFDTG
jgi:hypothetical protein